MISADELLTLFLHLHRPVSHKRATRLVVANSIVPKKMDIAIVDVDALLNTMETSLLLAGMTTKMASLPPHVPAKRLV